jgi:hypothetical protein
LTQVKDSSPTFKYTEKKYRQYITSEQEKTMKTLTDLKERVRQLEELIAETKKRLPAHSVKPPVMMDLLALEDEYEEILAEIAALSKDGGNRV